MAKDEGFDERMQEELHRRFGQDVIALVAQGIERKQKKRRY